MNLTFSEQINMPLERLHYSANGYCSRAMTNGCDGPHAVTDGRRH